MHQAIINTWGSAPKWTSVPDLPPPASDEVRIKVEAVGIHRVVRSRASGKHYSSGDPPHVPGIDGVGTTEDGQRVYFFTFAEGVLSEYINLKKNAVSPLPEGSDPIQVAAGMNPAMSSWMAIKSRTKNLPQDWTCLILGATSASGRVAIHLARAFGAKKVIGVARNQQTLDTLGLDRTIPIASNTDFTNLSDVDVILDYIYGDITLHLLKSLNPPKPVQYVQIGQLAMQDFNLPGSVLRSKDITIRGAGPGSWKMEDFVKSLPELLGAMKDVQDQTVKVVSVRDVEREWEVEGKERLVFVP